MLKCQQQIIFIMFNVTILTGIDGIMLEQTREIILYDCMQNHIIMIGLIIRKLCLFTCHCHRFIILFII